MALFEFRRWRRRPTQHHIGATQKSEPTVGPSPIRPGTSRYAKRGFRFVEPREKQALAKPFDRCGLV